MKSIIVQKIRVAIYCRVSSDEAGQSLAEQVHICKEMIQAAAKARGILYEILYTLIEEVGTSGKNDERPEYKKLLRLIDLKAIDWVGSKEISRLSRNTGGFHNLVEKCKKANVSIFVTGLEIDLKSPTGEIIPNILAVFAQYERQMISQRTKTSIRSLVLTKSKIHGQVVILGFRRGNEPGVWIPVEEEIQTVISIFRTFLKFKSYKLCLDYLKRVGIKNKSGKEFRSTSLKGLLSNRKYIGKLGVPGEDTEVNLPFGATVDLEIFDAAQKVIASIENEMKAQNRCPNRTYLLSGILFSSSGSSFKGVSALGRSKDRYYYYRASEDNLTFSCKELEDTIIRTVEHICQKEGISEYRASVEVAQEDEKVQLKRSLIITEKEIDRLHSLKKNSLDSILSKADFSSLLVIEVEERLSSLNSEIQSLVQKREKLILSFEKLAATEIAIGSLERLVKAGEGPSKDYSDRQAVRTWFRDLFHRIVIDIETKKISIYWNDQITDGNLLLPFKADLPFGSRKNSMESVLDVEGKALSETRLYELAVSKGMTSSEIANEFGVSRSTVSKYLKRFSIPALKIGSNKKRVRGVMLGSKFLRNGKKVKIVDEQKTLSAIKHWREKGKSFREIADILNVQKIPTKTGVGIWHGKTIQQLLVCQQLIRS